MRNPNTLIIDYYQGAYGPTVRIDIILLEELVRFRDVIYNLRIGKLTNFNIKSIDKIEMSGLYELNMRRELNGSQDYQNIIMIKSHSGLILEWTENEEKWLQIEGLIDGLINCNKPGHQYLTEDGEGLRIEIGYME